MARRRGFFAELQRDLERQRLQAERAQRAAVREQERLEREAARRAAQSEREAKRLHPEARERTVDRLNADVSGRLDELQGLLHATLSVDDHVDLLALMPTWAPPRFDDRGLARPLAEPELVMPAAPGGLKAMVPGTRRSYDEAVEAARTRHAATLAEHREREAERHRELSRLRAICDARVARRRAEYEEAVADVDRFGSAVACGKPDAIAEYFGLVLNASRYPEGIPRAHRLAYVPESRQLVVEFELPTLDVVPAEKGFRYVKARDEITTAERTAKDPKERYASVLAQISLRTIHELFEADREDAIETIVFNGIVDSVDPRTGQGVRPCLITCARRAIVSTISTWRWSTRRHACGTSAPPCPRARLSWLRYGRCSSSTWSTLVSSRRAMCSVVSISGRTSWSSRRVSLNR